MNESESYRVPAVDTLSLRIMSLACLVVFMTQMATTIYLPSLPVVMRELGMTQSATELSISIFVVGAAVPVIFWGAAADRYGRRISLTLSLVLFIGTSLLLAWCRDANLLLVLRALQGIGAGGAAIIGRILVKDNWSGAELAKRLSVLSVAFITALGGGQFIGGLISYYLHWQVAFLVLAATGFVALLFSLTVPMAYAEPARISKGMAHAYLTILRRPGFFWPACVGGLGFATTVTLQEVSPFVMQQSFGLEVTSFGLFGLLIGISYLAGALTVNRIVHATGVVTLMRRGSLMVAISALALLVLWWAGLLSHTSGLVIFILLYCLIIFGQAVMFPSSMSAAVNDGKDFGAYAMALCGFLQQGMAGIASSFAVLLEHHGTWTLAILLTGLASFLIARFKVHA
ncbi:MFS transporter [Rahnella perminowiae]|nr:MFS transporter [Rahnella perminowiae]MCR9001831.1 MFS transporter [Rahnella perminowiae]